MPGASKVLLEVLQDTLTIGLGADFCRWVVVNRQPFTPCLCITRCVNLGIERLRHPRDLVAIATAKHFDVAIAETCQKAHAIELRQRPARLARTALMFSLSGSRKN